MEAQERVARVLIVDGLKAVREGLAALLSCEAELEVVGEASSEAEVLRMLPRVRPDLVLLDLDLPIQKKNTLLRALQRAGVRGVIGMGLGGDITHKCQRLDSLCRGYIQKGASPSCVLQVVRAALLNEPIDPAPERGVYYPRLYKTNARFF